MWLKSSFTTPAVTAISFCLIGGTSPAPAYADLGDQLARLQAKDFDFQDNFGISVAISGATAIVGAYLDDDNGDASGSAYLFDAAATGMCPWDLDGSGSVGTSDLLELLGQWGTDGQADFDESGAVGTADLLILLANWGPCPK